MGPLAWERELDHRGMGAAAAKKPEAERPSDGRCQAPWIERCSIEASWSTFGTKTQRRVTGKSLGTSDGDKVRWAGDKDVKIL